MSPPLRLFAMLPFFFAFPPPPFRIPTFLVDCCCEFPGSFIFPGSPYTPRVVTPPTTNYPPGIAPSVPCFLSQYPNLDCLFLYPKSSSFFFTSFGLRARHSHSARFFFPGLPPLFFFMTPLFFFSPPARFHPKYKDPLVRIFLPDFFF